MRVGLLVVCAVALCGCHLVLGLQSAPADDGSPQDAPRLDAADPDAGAPDGPQLDAPLPDVLVAGDLPLPDVMTSLDVPVQPDLPSPDAAPWPDAAPSPDAAPWPDTAPWPDVASQPDLVPSPDQQQPDLVPSPDQQQPDLTPPPPQVVITEMMINPKGQDPMGEWFELYNAGTTKVSLHNWKLQDKDASHIINDPALEIPAKGYVVLGGAQAAMTGAVYTYTTGTDCPNELCFPNDIQDHLALFDAQGNAVDLVTYTTSWPFAEGASMSVKDPTKDNSVSTAWCQETATKYDGKNFGTPGAPAGCP